MSNVLVVEDNVIAQTVAKMILTDLGCRVEIAENGKQALLKFKQEKYNLIFMDIGLPDISGLEVAKEIRKLEDNIKVPIVALTANYSTQDKAIFLAAGMNDFLQKPLTKENASLILNQFVGGGVIK